MGDDGIRSNPASAMIERVAGYFGQAAGLRLGKLVNLACGPQWSALAMDFRYSIASMAVGR